MSRFLLFFLVVGVLMSVLGLYVHRRASHVFGLERRGRVALGLTIVVGVGLFFLRRVIGDGEVGRELVILGAAFAMAIVLAAGLLFHVDAVRGLWWAGEKALGRGKRPPADAVAKRAVADAVSTDVVSTDVVSTDVVSTMEARPSEAASEEPAIEHESWISPSAMGRRAFNRHASAAALTLGTGSAFYGALFGRRDYTIEEVPIPIAGLPRTLDGLTIVQLSDIHVGSFVGEGELRAAESLVREARPDLIVLTGDLLDHDAAYAPQLGRFVERLRPLARFGVAAIPGNHDHYAGVEAVEEALRRAGAHLMTNAGRLIGDGGGAFGLVGVDDLWAKEGRAPNLERALAMVPRDVPKILLAHQPVFLEQAVGKVQLQLSGHTHGGQVSLGWNPAELVLPNGWVRGRYDVGESILYVNRGFGTAGPPTRLFSPPEVTKLVLVAA
ncbi:MAG: metallophosphoesterase [Sandaracinus sp.]|nr:metallophosphoesterase [Sandaracinus sp.]